MSNYDDEFCSDCKRLTQSIHDHATGDSICQECGLVLDSRIADETAEWRIFANDDGNDRDPVRVGAPSNPFLDQERTVLETTFVNLGQRDGEGLRILKGTLQTVDKSHNSLVRAFTSIDEICERLFVNKIVKDFACHLYSKVHPCKIETRRDNKLAAGCVYIASQKQNQSRTLKEMSMASGVPEKKIVIATKLIKKVLNEMVSTSTLQSTSMDLGSKTDQQVNDYLKRFAYQVNLNAQAIKAAQEILNNIVKIDIIRRSPKTIAAGIIYVMCQLCGHTTTAKDISYVTNTSESTIKKSYKDLYPYLKLIVPSWFASEAVLATLNAA